ncbi:FtsW/RodA/SpoVE family cell cycle protein [Bacillus alkalisoli]|uniref:FtsW/RodA/SpoVE family cell cycle protein n=1 Tax=Bacillus alkalisoli TaxID=2011008 RepID=UPI000C2402EC|nr:FtsW/RodA/SpoVE family cell cycle protein [Bacillus alkalisoli]
MEQDSVVSWKIDYTLLFTIFLLAIISFIMLLSIQPTLPTKLQPISFVHKQFFWYSVGIFAGGACLFIDYDRFQMIGMYLYGFGLVLLIGLELPLSSYVQTLNGATSWYRLPGIGNIQPSEFMKVAYIIACSILLSKNKKKLMEKELEGEALLRSEWILLGQLALLFILPTLLLIRQPDLGMTMVYGAIFLTYLLISEVRWSILLTIFGVGIVTFSSLVFSYLRFPAFFNKYIIHEYQLGRVWGWLDPYQHQDAYGFQLVQSLKAIGAGTLYGTGLGHVEVSLPEAHTDFIFAMIAEQFGFIGASIVIALFFFLIFRIISISLQCHDYFGSYICAGIVGMISFQVFQNIGMTVGLLPITGLPLPFVSYGGSSLVSYMICIGLVLNVFARTKNYMFE